MKLEAGMESPVRNWTEVELAQLATFIDCEGCIAIHRNKPTPLAKSPSHALRVFVANTCLPAIQYLAATYGGKVSTQERNLKNPKWRPHYRWWTGSNHALLLLQLAEPYFHIKQEEVAVAIDFQHRINLYRTQRPWRQPVAPEELAWRQDQMDRLSALKHR